MKDKIKCPNCGHNFDVEEALSGQLQAHFKAEFEKKVAEQAKVFNNEKAKLEKEKEEFEEKKEKENELFKEKLEQKIAKEKEKIQNQTKESFELQLKALQEENDKRKEENRELKSKELDLLKRENELKEKTEEQELNLQKQLLEKQKEIEEKGRAKEREANQLKEKEYQKQLDEQKKLIEEMKRKAEQGSMQLQGEVQELALEELLNLAFPFDNISEVPKGINGADVIQTVINSNQVECGTIVFESKRTKNFDKKWIDKLKQDQVRVKGDIAVLVTQTLPSELDRFDFINGVWICHFNEVKSLTKVLRETLLKAQSVMTIQENKGDKMELLYNYLTGNDFIQKVKRIIENYDGMINQLNSEKKATYRMWGEREKQIWVVQENINAMFGDIKGIAGSSISSSDLLELPEPNIDE
ncbi:MAG: Caldesmon [Flavobacteriaceae bacterium]|nr:Caldesmon [Flavobacteriaceae bacterium]